VGGGGAFLGIGVRMSALIHLFKIRTSKASIFITAVEQALLEIGILKSDGDIDCRGQYFKEF
jgi:hypothetical protein